MSQVLKIAVFGLNTVDLTELKKQILICLPLEITVQWVNIAEKQIDVLYVNDIFFNSPGIEKILKEKACPYLRLTKSDHRLGEIIGDQLIIPIYNVTHLKKWIAQNLLSNAVTEYQNQLSQVNTLSHQPKSVNNSHNFNSVFAEMFIARNGHIQLYDKNGFIALVDTRTERVWVDEKTTHLQFNETLNQTYAKAQIVNMYSQNKTVYDLKAWLWMNISSLSTDLLPKIDIKQNFKLEIWPQFEKNLHRKDLLKMAACFELGANIDDVKNYLNLSEEKITQFVSYASLLQLGSFIKDEDVKFSLHSNTSELGQKNKLKSFFGKLRKKLGL